MTSENENTQHNATRDFHKSKQLSECIVHNIMINVNWTIVTAAVDLKMIGK